MGVGWCVCWLVCFVFGVVWVCVCVGVCICVCFCFCFVFVVVLFCFVLFCFFFLLYYCSGQVWKAKCLVPCKQSRNTLQSMALYVLPTWHISIIHIFLTFQSESQNFPAWSFLVDLFFPGLVDVKNWKFVIVLAGRNRHNSIIPKLQSWELSWS